MPRFSKPVVEDENGELIMPGAYGAAPGGFCERRSTFEWDNQDRAQPMPLINVDELSVDLSEDDEEEPPARAAAETSEETPPAAAAAEEEEDEEMGLPTQEAEPPSAHQSSTPANSESTRASSNSSQEELLDATVEQAPPRSTSFWARTCPCHPSTAHTHNNNNNNNKRSKLTGMTILFGVVLALAGLVVWTQLGGTTSPTHSGQIPSSSQSQSSDTSFFDPPSQRVAYRADLGLQQLIGQVLHNPNQQLQPNWTSPYWEALYWILYEDPMQLTPNQRSAQAIQQRYLLAAFYFATSIPFHRPNTQERYQPRIWKQCAQPTTPPLRVVVVVNDTSSHHVRQMQCTHQYLTQERPSRLFAPVPNSWRWLTSTPECQWAGVQCNEHGSVTSIVLGDYGLTGHILPELVHLQDLVQLSLPYNDYLGGSIPSGLFQLSKLELQYNQHTATLVPPDIAQHNNVSAMEILNLAGNQLSGSLPLQAWEHMTNLRQISLQENSFTGSLPSGTTWQALELIRAQNNDFNGTIPTPLVANPNLRVVDLSHNQHLQGTIPSQIGSSTLLRSLGLAHNQLTGSIPLQLYDCTDLRSLDLQANRLEGTMATQIGRLQRLQDLFWQDNHYLEGTLPTELGSLKDIAEFHINGNRFEGQVPQEFCDLGVDGYPLANTAIVVADCYPEPDNHNASSTDASVVVPLECPVGCCSECCQPSTGHCTTNPLAILGLGTRTP